MIRVCTYRPYRMSQKFDAHVRPEAANVIGAINIAIILAQLGVTSFELTFSEKPDLRPDTRRATVVVHAM